MHQITEAQSQGYDEEEIVNSVIRSMVPSLTLRNVLETTPNLTLQRLKQFLEAHFDEKNATDLCGKLTSMIQLPEESEYNYVMRCIEVRQKVILASSKSVSEIKYDKGLVMKLFYRTLERGLLSSYVVQEIKPLLRSNVSDEELIAAVTKASASEKERNTALSKIKRPPTKVHEIDASKLNQQQIAVSSNQVSQILSAVESLTKQVSTLQSELNDVKKENFYMKTDKKYSGNNKPACKNCKENNKLNCTHCYKCGSADHYARGCRASTGQGN